MNEISAQVSVLLTARLSRPEIQPTVRESMLYSALAGGKRIRPFLTVAVAEMLAAPEEKEKAVDAALSLGTSLEMIHTYSLIHDDLPCMDNDDLRRGKPSNHKVYGEAGAVLAGDGLLTEAFFTVANASLSDAQKVRAVWLLSAAAGGAGMVGGQSLDLENEGKPITARELDGINSLKTGALLICAGLLGCAAAGKLTDDEDVRRVVTYCDNIGRSFQLVDDLLDATGDAAALGKNVGVDAQNEKTTYVTLLGVDGCLAEAKRLTEAAISAIEPFENSALLTELAHYLLERRS